MSTADPDITQRTIPRKQLANNTAPTMQVKADDFGVPAPASPSNPTNVANQLSSVQPQQQHHPMDPRIAAAASSSGVPVGPAAISMTTAAALAAAGLGGSNGVPAGVSAPFHSSSVGQERLVMPEGVVLPPSVEPSLLEGRVRTMLFQLPVDQINEALVEYDDAVKNKGGQIRNHQAYLVGVVKRYVAVQEKAARGDGGGAKPMGELTERVQDRLRTMVATNFCSEEDLSEKVRTKLKMLPERDAISAIDEITSVDKKQIRNFGSYFMGILNRYMRGEETPMQHKDRNRPGPRHGRARQDVGAQGRDSLDSRDGRFAGRGGRSRENRGANRGRSPDRDRKYRRNGGQGWDESPRSRHRDRDDNRRPYDRDRYDRDYDDRPRDRSRDRFDRDRYDDRYDDDDRPPRRGNRRSYSDYDDSPHRSEYSYRRDRSDRDDSYHDRDRDRDSRRSSYRADRNMPSADSSRRGGVGGQPSNALNQQQQQPNASGFGTSVPPPPPPRAVPPPPPQQGGVPTIASFQQPQAQTQQFLQANQPQFLQMQPTNQTPSLLQGLPSQQFVPQAINNSNPQPVAAPAPVFAMPPSSLVNQQVFGAQQQHQQPTTAQTGILQQPKQEMQQQVTYQTPTSVAPAPFVTAFSNVPQSGGNVPQSGWQQGQPQQAPHTDILGIADKAASAVQALSSQSAQRQQTSQIVAALQHHAPPQVPVSQQQQQSYDLSRLTQSSRVPKSVNSAESVSAKDLPMMVQYALQNLQATGHLDGKLDAGICRMIKQLPESVALQSLERFSSCDQSTMRNKTAYLAGILRREMDKLGKHQ